MTRRDNTALRCPRCRLHQSLCLCAEVRRLDTRTRVIVVLHHSEAHRPTNTGRLATLALANSELVVRQPATPPLAVAAGTTPVVLFPSEDAAPLAEVVGPLTLVVPDGSWRQAKRMRGRLPGLGAPRCVTLPAGPPSQYRLRAEPRVGGLATLEAIARALAILEGPAVATELERLLRVMVERTLWSRGRIAAAEVTTGLPVGVMRHEPRRSPRG